MMRTPTLLLLLCSAVPVLSQPGTLDATFGNGGIVQMDLMPAGDAGFDVLPMADGRLYICGYLDDGPRDNGYVLRLMPDGTPDPDFGTMLLPSATNARATRMAYAPDSSLYFCGYADTLGYETFALWHVLTNGLIDADFGFGGRSSVQIGFSDARARDLAVQADGKVVLVGYESAGFGRDGVIVRLLPDGTPDPDFSGDGILVLSSFDDLDQLDAVTLLDDGSIVAGGYAEIEDDDRALLVKLAPAGNLDGSFDGDGMLTPLLSANSRIYAVASDGLEIVAAGPLILSSTSADLYITRRQANGAIDTDFGSFGVAEIDVTDDDWMDDMKILPDGRIALTGYTGSTAPGGDIDFLLACYEANGQPDTGFGNNGMVITETSPSYEGGYSVCVQPDGKLVVAGFGGQIGNSSMVVLRYANDLGTGLGSAPYNAELTAFPNPAHTHCRLRTNKPLGVLDHIELLDLHGRVVRAWSGTGMAELVIDRGDLPTGIYTLRLQCSEEPATSIRLVFQ